MRAILQTVIASGTSISDIVNLQELAGIRSIEIPTITSGDLLIQGATNCGSGLSVPLSGDFVRMLDVRGAGSAELRFATGPGSKMIGWPATITLPPYIRIETSVAQGAPRTITIFAQR